MGLYTRTYADKSNTIVKSSNVNLSLNPIIDLNYGRMLTRGLIHFPHEKVRRLIEEGVYNGTESLRHVLRMTNSASVNDRRLNCVWPDSQHNGQRQRAASFDLIFFLIPKEWDGGKGFDYTKDMYNTYGRGLSAEASNWYRNKSHCNWDEEGIYTTDTLSHELDLFTSKDGNKSKIIIGYNHFDMGNEPIELDVTDTFNKFITGEMCNYGIGIAFSPKYEDLSTGITQYVGFFNGHTNSYYEPFIETTTSDYVLDDRLNFCAGRTNRLYFFSAAGGHPIELDNIPHAEIDGIPYDVKKSAKGAYYIEVDGDGFEPDTMYSDVWSDINVDGHHMADVEMDFVTKEADTFFTLGKPSQQSAKDFVPYLYGITHREHIRRGDVRKVTVDCKIPYTSDQTYTEGSIQYRIYTKNGGNTEIDVTGYLPTERAYDKNYFLVDTESLIPSKYHVDVKIRHGYEEITHKEALTFFITDDETLKYN